MLKELPEHRLTFLVRILPWDKTDSHDCDYTAYLRRLRFDNVLGIPYYLPYVDEDPFYMGEGNLLETPLHHLDENPLISSTDYTDFRPFLIKPEDIYDPPEGLTLCHKYSMKTIRKAITTWRELESETPHSSRKLPLLKYYRRAIGDYREWALSRGLSFPQLSDPFSKYPRKLKDQFKEEFLKLINDPNATEELVREILYDKKRFSGNPSKYLRDAREDEGLSESELRKYPGFGFVGQKGSSKR